MRRWGIVALALLASAACSDKTAVESPGGAACPARADEHARAAELGADGYLHSALDTLLALDTQCSTQRTQLAVAQVYADLGVDRLAIQWYERYAASGGDAAASAAQAIAALRARPALDRPVPADDRERALMLYRDGVSLRHFEDYAGSLASLRRSYALWPSPLTVTQIAMTHKASGEMVEFRKANARALAIAEEKSGARAVPRVHAAGTGNPASVAMHPGGRYVAVSSVHGEVEIWDLTSGTIAQTLDRVSDAVSYVKFVSAGASLLSVGKPGTLRVNDLTTATELRTMGEGDSDITAIAYASMGKGHLAAYGTDDGRVVVVDATTGDPIHTFRGAGTARVLELSSDGWRIAAGDWSGNVDVWDIRTGERVRSIAMVPAGAGPAMVVGIAFSSNGNTIAAGASDGRVAAWSVDDGTERWSTVAHGPEVTTVSVTGDSDLIAAANNDGAIRIWRIADGTLAHSFAGHESVTSIALSPGAEQLASCGSDKAIRIWEVSSGTPLSVLRPETSGVYAVAIKEGLVAIGSADGTIATWRLADGLGTLDVRVAHGSTVNDVAHGPNGLLVSGGGDAAIHVWTPGTATPARSFVGPEYGVDYVAMSADGRYVAASGSSTELLVWDMSVQSEPLRIEGEYWGGPLAFVDHYLVSASAGGSIDLFDVGMGATSGRRIGRHAARIMDVDVTADGAYVYVGDLDNTIHAWELGTGRLVRTMVGHDGYVDSLSLSADQDRLVSSSYDRTLRVWDTETGAEVARFDDAGAVLDLDHHGQRLVVTGSLAGLVQLWDTESTDDGLLATITIRADGGWLVITPDGRVDSSAPDGGPALYWQVGDYRLPGFVGWQRQRVDGLLLGACGALCR